MENTEETEWSSLTPEEKKRKLFEKQKQLLDEFLVHGAISQAQHDKSLNCMAEKMGYKV